jgi:hypothetical protein
MGRRPILLERNDVDLPLKARRRATTLAEGCTDGWTLFHSSGKYEAHLTGAPNDS